MDPSTSDESAGQSRGGWRRDAGAVDVSLALADPPPSMTAAHWANRDNETLYRRPGQNGTPRRPPAENSFPEDTGVPQVPRSPQLPPADAPGGSFFAVPSPSAPPVAGPPPSGPTLPDAALPGPSSSGATSSGPTPSGAPVSGAGTGGVSGPRGLAASAGRTGSTGEVPVTGFGYGSGRPAADSPPTGRPPTGRPPTGRPQAGRPQNGGPQTGGPQTGGPQGSTPGRGRIPGPRDRSADDIGVLGGPGRDIRPHRATAGAGPAKEKKEKAARDSGAPRRRSRVPLVLGLVVTAVVFAGVGTAAMAVFTGEPAAVADLLGVEDTGTGDARTVTAPLGGRTESALEIVTGTTQVTMRSEDLGDDLYRITTPGDSGALPRPVVDGDRVQLQLTPADDGNAGGVEVVLSSKVRWALRFAGSSDEDKIDMSQGRVSSVDIAGGARRFELTLPQATGTVGVRLAGAVDEFVITAPKDSPVRVQAGSGVKTVAAGAKTLRDVKPGSTITPKDWDGENRYDIDAAGKVSLLSITNEG